MAQTNPAMTTDTSNQNHTNEKPTPVTSVSEFLQYIDKKRYLDPTRKEVTAYRGHFKNYDEIKPSIGRIDDYDGKKERELFMQFKRSYHYFTNHRPKRDIDLLFLAQHYGLKTRILDWTLNPLVALFFACYEDSPSKSEENEDGEVIIKIFPKPGSLREDTSENDKLGWHAFLHQLERGNYPVSEKSDMNETLIFPDNFDARIRNQKGVFQYFKNPNQKIEVFKAIPVSHQAKGKILNELVLLGIDESFIYPDLEHFAKQLSKQCINEQDTNQNISNSKEQDSNTKHNTNSK